MTGLQVEADWHVADDGDQVLAEECLIPAFLQCVAEAAAADLIQMLVDGLEAPVLLEQLGGRLVADTAHAGNVVTCITDEGFVVDQLLRLQAIALADATLVVDDGIAEGAPGGHDPDVRADELEGVGVAGDYERLQALLLRLLGQRGQYVVGLVALGRVGGYVKGLQQLVDALELDAQVIGHFGAVGLVLGVLFMAEGAPTVKGHGQKVGLLVAQHVEQHGSKAKHGVGQLATGRGHAGRKGKVGAIDQCVPVDQYQFGRISHQCLLVCSRRRVSRGAVNDKSSKYALVPHAQFASTDYTPKQVLRQAGLVATELFLSIQSIPCRFDTPGERIYHTRGQN